MHLYFRLIWLLLTYRWKPALHFGEPVIRHQRVMPNDLDFNGHMNNGRYLTLVDLAIIEMFLRTGTCFKMLRQGWRPMLGASCITFRRGLKLFESYQLCFRLISRDHRWNYFQFEFLVDGKTAAMGYVKGGIVTPKGWLHNTEADAFFEVDHAPEAPTEGLQNWIASETALTHLIKK